MKRFVRAWVLLNILICLPGCANLTRAFATDKISEAPDFKNPPMLIIHLGHLTRDCEYGLPQIGPEERFLSAVGLITVSKIGAGAVDVRLTEKGIEFLSRQDQKPYAHEVRRSCVRDQINFPVATRKFMGVSGISFSDQNNARVEFRWTWNLNEIGKVLTKDQQPDVFLECKGHPVNHFSGEISPCVYPLPGDEYGWQSSAIFQKYDDGWRMQP